MILVAGRSLLLVSLASFALQAAPLKTSDLGVPKYIKVGQVGTNYQLGNGGGGWTGKVSPLSPLAKDASNANIFNPNGSVVDGKNPFPSAAQTVFWCVDSQLQFSLGNQGWANIVSLSELPSPDVRYGNDATNWTNDNMPVTNDSLSPLSQVRFRMAAWLVSNYSPFPAGPSNTESNRTIQHAIWAVMHNVNPVQPTGTADLAGYKDITGQPTTTNTVAWWVDQARQNFGSVDTTKWAVVSWLASPQGVLQNKGGTLTDDRQTFLVQVVPEPGFYGVLAGGLGALVWLTRRRRAES